MMSTSSRLAACACVGASILSSVTTHARTLPPAYTIVPVPLPAGSTDGRAYDINADGVVAGDGFGDVGQPFVWDGHSAAPTVLTSASSTLRAISNAGQAVGGYTLGSSFHAFTWKSPGPIADIHNFTGNFSYASGVNDAGVIVGRAGSSSATSPFIRLSPANTVLIPRDGFANDVNAANIVVGSVDRGFDGRAFMWTQQSGFVNIGEIPGSTGKLLVAEAINDAGYITGLGYKDAQLHGFLRAPNGAVTQFTTSIGSVGTDVNNLNQVVGLVESAGAAADDAMIWDAQSGVVQLETLIAPGSGWDLQVASAINDAGQIVGWGKFNGAPRPFLMTPVPEPLGFGSLGAFSVLATLLMQRSRELRV